MSYIATAIIIVSACIIMGIFGFVAFCCAIYNCRHISPVFGLDSKTPQWDPLIAISAKQGSPGELLGSLAQLHAFAFGESEKLPVGTRAGLLGDKGRELIALVIQQSDEDVATVLFKGPSSSPLHARKQLHWPEKLPLVDVGDTWASKYSPADIRMQPWGDGKGNIHSGFYDSYLRLRHRLIPLISNVPRLRLCGHSVGATHALMLAYDLAHKVETCVCVGAPCCGDKNWASTHPARNKVLNFRNMHDRVTMEPLPHLPKFLRSSTIPLVDYQHVGKDNIFSGPDTEQASANSLLAYQRYASHF
jgi:Lipase (class 3)